jgi:hypothetical protein
MMTVADPDLSGWDFGHRENDVRSATTSHPPFFAARLAVSLLAELVYRVGRDPVIKNAAGEDLRRVALSNLGALTVRSSNIVLLLVESGYAPDAFAPQRRLLEILLRTREIYRDELGVAAGRWLAHKKFTPMAKLLVVNPEFKRAYERLSRMAHDDRRALTTLYSPPPWVECPPSKRALNLFPTMPPPATVGLLRALIEHVVEITVCIADVHGEEIVIPAQVGEVLTAAAD